MFAEQEREAERHRELLAISRPSSAPTDHSGPQPASAAPNILVVNHEPAAPHLPPPRLQIRPSSAPNGEEEAGASSGVDARRLEEISLGLAALRVHHVDLKAQHTAEFKRLRFKIHQASSLASRGRLFLLLPFTLQPPAFSLRCCQRFSVRVSSWSCR